MPMQVFDVVQNIYEDLTREDLFFRCHGGFTENPNERLIAVIWSIVPKAISSGKSVVDIATNIAVITYNHGFRGLLDLMSTLQLKIISELYNFSVEVDQRQIKAVNRSASEHRKSAQKDLRSLKKEAEEQHSYPEEQLYGAAMGG